MKQIFFLLSTLCFITSCSPGKSKKQTNGERVSISPGQAENKVIQDLPPEDPSFVMPENITSAHGPSNITRNILQDKNRTIWFATWEGVISYDGKLFTNHTLQANLRRFHVFSIAEDGAGNIWFGTIGGGVYRYDGRSFRYFTTADGLAGNTVLCIMADKDGNIWFGTKDGASRYNDKAVQGKSFTNFTTSDGLSHNFINAIVQDQTGKIWFGTRGGLSCYVPVDSASRAKNSPAANRFTDFTNDKGYPFAMVFALLKDKTGNIWIGSNDGLWRYEVEQTKSASTRSQLTQLTTHPTNQVYEDAPGNFWLSEGKVDGSEMTLIKYDGMYFTEIKSDKQIFGITGDRSGNIWFGTQNGACRYDPASPGEKSFTNFKD
jgi:ligand-binding sensor domain-containing protein